MRNKHLFLKQDTCFFSARGDFTPCRNVTMPGNVFDCQDWEPASSKWLESTGKLLCFSPCSRQPRATKHCLVPDINSAKVRNPALAQQCLCACSIISVVSDSLRPMDYSPPRSSVHGILQARVLEWVAILFARDVSDPGTELGSPVFQVDSLPSEPPGKLLGQ